MFQTAFEECYSQFEQPSVYHCKKKKLNYNVQMILQSLDGTSMQTLESLYTYLFTFLFTFLFFLTAQPVMYFTGPKLTAY